MLSINDKDKTIADYLKSISIGYDVTHTAEMLHDEWPHDLFYVAFSRPHRIVGGQTIKPAVKGFEYKTGIGHRVNPPRSKNGFTSRQLSPKQRAVKKQLDRIIGQNSVVEAKRATAKGPVSAEYITKPTQASVLYSLLLDSEAENENFEDWATNCGYDSDSIKALEIYRACLANAKKLRAIFTREQCEHLRELLEDY